MAVTNADPELACTYALFMESRGDSARARQLYEQAVRSPGLPQTPYFESVIRLHRAHYFERDGHPDSARAEYARSRSLAAPGSGEAREDSLALRRLGGR